MTEKQQGKIREMIECNALYAYVSLSFKETPESVETFKVKLRKYVETNETDVSEDDDVFFHFDGIDELISAFDRDNGNFDFTILSIQSFDGYAYDRNGFEIRRGDTLLYKYPVTGEVTEYYVYEEPTSDMVKLCNDYSECEAFPSECEVDDDLIKVSLTDIRWDDDDEGDDLPDRVETTINELNSHYGFLHFNDYEINCAINEFLSNTYGFCVSSYGVCFNRKTLFKEEVKAETKEAEEATGKFYGAIEKAAKEALEAIKRKVASTERKFILFNDDVAPYIPLQDCYLEHLTKVQGLAIFAENVLAAYYGDDDYCEKDLTDEKVVEEILDGDYWQTYVFTDDNPDYITAILSVAKYLNI